MSKTGFRQPRPLHRDRHELAQRGLEFLVDLAVEPRHVVRDARIAAVERVHRDPHGLGGELRHVPQRPVHHARRPGRASAGAREREARDLLRLVAGPLEVGHGARDREHGAQVARDRRLPREQAEALRLDLGLPGVDLLLAPQHELGRLAVGFEQRPHGGLDLLRHQRAHLVRAHAQLRQRAVIGLDGVALAGLVHAASPPAQP